MGRIILWLLQAQQMQLLEHSDVEEFTELLETVRCCACVRHTHFLTALGFQGNFAKPSGHVRECGVCVHALVLRAECNARSTTFGLE